MRRKNFTMASGKYYFNIKNGQSNITISREQKREAETAYHYYKAIGKNCEWLGFWNGKSFDENKEPIKKEAS